MRAKKLDRVRFAHAGKNSFQDAVMSRANAYFRVNKLSRYANTAMWVKTVVMLLLYFIPYVFMVTGLASGQPWLFFGLWFLMGWGMIGIGTSVMHDANHESYSPNPNVNKFIGGILEVIGGYSITWKIQHNQLHHTYTNIAGLDEDLDSIKYLRFSPRQPHYWYHKYQYLYAWFFYAILTLFWMTAKDYIQVIRYKRHDLLISHKISLRQAIFRITLYKIFYYSYIMVLPILFSGFPWYAVVFGFLVMHFTAGIVLSCIFQPSHIVEASTFELPVGSEPDSKQMEDSWAIHEVENTTNFAQRKKFFTWFFGGLNYQIEHHLFSGICHVHYPQLAPLVRKTAAEYGVTYHVEPTFWKALKGHVKMLKKLGT
jgi:linoleoyl-CoA desaturase